MSHIIPDSQGVFGIRACQKGLSFSAAGGTNQSHSAAAGLRGNGELWSLQFWEVKPGP